MEPRYSVALALLVSLTILAGRASAYCPGNDKSEPDYDPEYYSVSHEFSRSPYVVKARVIRETWLGDDGKPKALHPPFQDGARKPWGFGSYAGAYYDVKVQQVFKGEPKPELRLFSENSTARFWLDVGYDYWAAVARSPIRKSSCMREWRI